VTALRVAVVVLATIVVKRVIVLRTAPRRGRSFAGTVMRRATLARIARNLATILVSSAQTASRVSTPHLFLHNILDIY
jgi:hypothetical protein